MKIKPIHWLLGGAAVLGGLVILSTNAATITPKAGDAPARNERDRLAQLGQALLARAEQNPPTVTAAELRSVAAQLRTVQEPELARILDGAADRLPV